MCFENKFKFSKNYKVLQTYQDESDIVSKSSMIFWSNSELFKFCSDIVDEFYFCRAYGLCAYNNSLNLSILYVLKNLFSFVIVNAFTLSILYSYFFLSVHFKDSFLMDLIVILFTAIYTLFMYSVLFTECRLVNTHLGMISLRCITGVYWGQVFWFAHGGYFL